MNTFALVLFSLAAVSGSVSAGLFASRQDASCGGTCRFEFCRGDSSLTASFPVDRALTSAICLDGVTIGHVDETLEAHVAGGKISDYAPQGLKQRFSPSFFKAYSITDGTVKYETSGVGHERPQGNQADFLDGLCVVLPLGEYQIVDPKTGIVLENVATDDKKDCVSFVVDGEGVSPGLVSPSPGMFV